MSGHDPQSPTPERPASAQHTRDGLVLFAVYLVLYASFVLLNAFNPALMGAEAVGGINLAILSGLGLIAAAFLLAVGYGWLCRD